MNDVLSRLASRIAGTPAPLARPVIAPLFLGDLRAATLTRAAAAGQAAVADLATGTADARGDRGSERLVGDREDADRGASGHAHRHGRGDSDRDPEFLVAPALARPFGGDGENALFARVRDDDRQDDGEGRWDPHAPVRIGASPSGVTPARPRAPRLIDPDLMADAAGATVARMTDIDYQTSGAFRTAHRDADIDAAPSTQAAGRRSRTLLHAITDTIDADDRGARGELSPRARATAATGRLSESLLARIRALGDSVAALESSSAHRQAPPQIRVTIGRIDVRGLPAAAPIATPPPAPMRAAPTAIGLEKYLARGRETTP